MTNQSTVEQYLNTHKTFTSFDLFIEDMNKQIDFQQWQAQNPGCLGSWHMGVSKVILQTDEDFEKLQVYLDSFELGDYHTKTIDKIDIRLEISNIHKQENHFSYENGKITKKQQTGIVIGFQVRWSMITNAKAFVENDGLRMSMWKQNYAGLKQAVFDTPCDEFYQSLFKTKSQLKREISE